MARFEQPEEVQNKEYIIEMTNITVDYHHQVVVACSLVRIIWNNFDY